MPPSWQTCQRFGVTELSLFGSAVRGEMGPESDIDVMVEFDPAARVGILKFESLVEGLEAVVGRKVDLVTKRGLKRWVRPQGSPRGSSHLCGMSFVLTGHTRRLQEECPESLSD
jgi:predicted nucleotidyltransferase